MSFIAVSLIICIKYSDVVADPSAVAVSRIRRIFYCRRKSAEK